ncbi:MAG TPA: Maf family protein [Phycisphaerae bacterium]|nr:Maf family protein [Phycisphaerae bacterium]HRR86766.1 Maf family protein [Phycisphaerae bacterium]
MPNGTCYEARPIILASQSPRRVDLLREAGIAFEAVAPTCVEPDVATWMRSPEEFVQLAAYQKVSSVAERYPDRVILGADTVVALNGRMYGKPADRDDARRILSALAGVTQDVITGVTILQPAKGRQLVECDVTRVTMRPMSEEEIEVYLDSGEWEGKAGAYGIQGTADRFVEKVEGSFSNVVGLPVERVLRMLAEFDIRPTYGFSRQPRVSDAQECE